MPYWLHSDSRFERSISWRFHVGIWKPRVYGFVPYGSAGL